MSPVMVWVEYPGRDSRVAWNHDLPPSVGDLIEAYGERFRVIRREWRSSRHDMVVYLEVFP